jgi:hypothetical protein
MSGDGRQFLHLRLTMDHCAGLREAISPLEPCALEQSQIVNFCARLYITYYALEADPDLEAIPFPADHADIMLINNFLSAEDGDWAKDLLHQTRQVLFELHTGKEAVKLASSEDTHALFQDVALEGDSPPAVDEKP